MCNLNSLSLGIQGANVLNDTIRGYAQDKAYEDYQKTKNAIIQSNFQNQSREINNAYAREQSANAIQKQQSYLKNLQAKSTLQASKATSGVNGSSVENLFRNFDRANAVNNYLFARDLNEMSADYNNKLTSLRTSALNSIASQHAYQSKGTSALFGGIRNLFGNYSNSLISRTQERPKRVLDL